MLQPTQMAYKLCKHNKTFPSYIKGLTMTKYKQFKSISWKQLHFSIVVMRANTTYSIQTYMNTSDYLVISNIYCNICSDPNANLPPIPYI